MFTRDGINRWKIEFISQMNDAYWTLDFNSETRAQTEKLKEKGKRGEKEERKN